MATTSFAESYTTLCQDSNIPIIPVYTLQHNSASPYRPHQRPCFRLMRVYAPANDQEPIRPLATIVHSQVSANDSPPSPALESLQSLNLTNLELPPGSMQAIGQTLASDMTIVELHLKACNLNASDFTHLVTIIPKTRIRALFLDHNPDLGTVNEPTLSAFQTLTSSQINLLSMRNCSLTDSHLSALALGLRAPTCILLVLYLARNPRFTHVGVDALANALCPNHALTPVQEPIIPALQALCLSGCQLTDECIVQLLKCLKSVPISQEDAALRKRYFSELERIKTLEQEAILAQEQAAAGNNNKKKLIPASAQKMAANTRTTSASMTPNAAKPVPVPAGKKSPELVAAKKSPVVPAQTKKSGVKKTDEEDMVSVTGASDESPLQSIQVSLGVDLEMYEEHGQAYYMWGNRTLMHINLAHNRLSSNVATSFSGIVSDQATHDKIIVTTNCYATDQKLRDRSKLGLVNVMLTGNLFATDNIALQDLHAQLEYKKQLASFSTPAASKSPSRITSGKR